MQPIVAGVIVLLLAWPALANDDKPQGKKEKKQPLTVQALPIIGGSPVNAASQDAPPADPNTPAGKYQALVKEYTQAQQAFFKAYRAAKTPAEKQKVLQEKQPNPDKYVAQFLELAQQHPKDPVAVDALTWVLQNSGSLPNAKDSPRSKALAMLLRDHVTSDRLGPVCQVLASDFQDKDAAALLRGIMEKNPDAKVQGDACLALAQLLDRKTGIAKDLADESNVKQYERFFGKELVAELKSLDTAKVEAQSEALYKRFADKYLSHVAAAQLDILVQRLSMSENKGSEAILRRLVSGNPPGIKAETRGKATMALAGMLKQRAEALPDAQAKEADKLNKESESLCERVVAKYGDVKNFRGPLGDQAKKQLFELRFLSKGKPAPEVSGEDLDGKPFKLSDYKGKVVLLDFWGNW